MDISFNILVTSACNGKCEFCSVMPWMNYNKGYQMSLEEIERFIYYSKLSNYKFKQVGVLGGEPLLWKNLTAGIKLLDEANLTPMLNIISNGLVINEKNRGLIDSILPYINKLKLSKYKGNETNIEFALKNFSNKKIEILQQEDGRVSPTKFIQNSLPATCRCRVFSYSNGRVDICSPARTMGYLPPESNPITLQSENFIILEDSLDKYSVHLQKNYLDNFKNINRFNQKYCQACVANTNIHKKIPVVKNKV